MSWLNKDKEHHDKINHPHTQHTISSFFFSHKVMTPPPLVVVPMKTPPRIVALHCLVLVLVAFSALSFFVFLIRHDSPEDVGRFDVSAKINALASFGDERGGADVVHAIRLEEEQDEEVDEVATEDAVEVTSEEEQEEEMVMINSTSSTSAEDGTVPQYVVPLFVKPLGSFGCPFGWQSPSELSTWCFHVSLSLLSVDEANRKCMSLGNDGGLRASLAFVESHEENAFLCKILMRVNNRFNRPDQILIGSSPVVSDTGEVQIVGWWGNSGEVVKSSSHSHKNVFAPYRIKHFRKSDMAKAFFENADSVAGADNEEEIATMPPKILTDRKVTMLTCSTKGSDIWEVAPDSFVPYACAAKKTKTWTPIAPFKDRDTTLNEIQSEESLKWSKIQPFNSDSLKSCPGLLDNNAQSTQHHSPLLSKLDAQILWKLTAKTKLHDEGERAFAIWQSKSWFGWLDFWVEYLAKYRDFHVAPWGKYVTSSRAAKERLGWSGIFSLPSLTQKYRNGGLVVMSRFPIPTHVLTYFPPGTLVNQIYTDPFASVPLGDKLDLVQILDEYAANLRCEGAADLAIMPHSFDLLDSKNCRRAFEYVRNQGKNSSWMFKTVRHGGAGIILGTSTQVVSRLTRLGCNPQSPPPSMPQPLRLEVLQQVIDNPLLLDGRKIDVRVFVLVSSTKPLMVFVHKEPYFRASMKKFQGSSFEKARLITNTHIQKNARSYNNFTDKDWADHILTPERVRLYASRAGIRPDFWSQVVFPRVKRSVRTIMLAASHTIVDRRPGQWKLFGVDFIVDEFFRPYLLDWNAFPGWDWSYRIPWALEYRKRILGDSWRVMLDIQRGKALDETKHMTPRSGGYELVFHGTQQN